MSSSTGTRPFTYQDSPYLGQPAPVWEAAEIDAGQISSDVNNYGIVAVRNALSFDLARGLHPTAERLFAESMSREGGTADRGRNRYYFAINPEEVEDVESILSNRSVMDICDATLGENWQFVEVGFDVNRPDSRYQYWHRDFVVPTGILEAKRVTSLAINFSTVDVTPAMGPFEVVTGTQFDLPLDTEGNPTWPRDMFPTYDLYERYAKHHQQLFGKLGGMSVRFASGIHHGTPNTTPFDGPLPDDKFVPGDRPVMIVGAVAETEGRQEHPLRFTKKFFDALPDGLKAHLKWAEVYDQQLPPVIQRHDFEGLMMGGTTSKNPQVQRFREELAQHNWIP